MAAFQLRSVIFGVPPVLPEIRSDLNLSFSATGGLSSIVTFCFGAFALPGALLLNRFGARQVMGIGLLAAGASGLIRLLPPSVFWLYAGTALLATSVAMCQPGLAVIARRWFPRAAQRASSVFSLGLNTGGMVAASGTVFLLGFGGWRGSFVIWSALAIAVALIWMWLAPGREETHERMPHSFNSLIRDREVWRAAGLFGSQSLVFFSVSTWSPFLLRAEGPTYVALFLFVLSVVGIPLQIMLSALRRPWATSRGFYILAGVLAIAGSVLLALGLTRLALLAGALVGAGATMGFAGALALPAIRAPSTADVAGYSALSFSLGYMLAFSGPLLGGILLDRTGSITTTFYPVLGGAALMLLLGVTIPRRRGLSPETAAPPA
jgi:CP family cyanate transporter-like MFS transporter